MSFLLLKSRPGRPAPSTQGAVRSKRSNLSIAVSRKSQGTASRSRFSLPASASDQGDQIQFHRPLHKRVQQQKQQQQHLTSRQRSRQKEQNSQQITKSQNEIVSMDEGKTKIIYYIMLFVRTLQLRVFMFSILAHTPTVMEDIRVLEQQQRDSQRLLTSIKQTKQHKLQEQSTLETNVSSLKYANGEAQAQLIRSREVLSKSTRDLGSSRLKSDRSSENIKKLDEKIKRGLATIRALHSKQRRACASMLKLHNAQEKLNMSIKNIKTQTKAQELTRDDLKHRGNLLAKSIQALKVEVKDFFDSTIQTRSEVSAFEKELTASQQLEGTTKNRVESIETERTSEDKTYEAVKLDFDKRIKSANNHITDIEAQIHDVGVDIEVNRRELIEAGQMCIRHQNVERHQVSTELEDAILDISRVKISTAKKEQLLRQSEREKINLAESVNALKQEQLELERKYEETKENIQKVTKLSNDRESQEKERSLAFEDQMLELKCQREKVAGLRNTIKGLQTTIRTSIECDEKCICNQEDKLKKGGNEREAMTTKIEGLNLRATELDLHAEDTKNENRESVDQVKSAANASKELFQNLQKEEELLPQSNEYEIDDILEEIVKKREEVLQDSSTEISTMLKSKCVSPCAFFHIHCTLFKSMLPNIFLSENPCLANLNLSFDHTQNVSFDEQVKVALSGLFAACKERVKEALVDYDGKIQQEKEERDRKLQCQEKERKMREIISEEKRKGKIQQVEKAKERNCSNVDGVEMQRSEENLEVMDRTNEFSFPEDELLENFGSTVDETKESKEKKRKGIVESRADNSETRQKKRKLMGRRKQSSKRKMYNIDSPKKVLVKELKLEARNQNNHHNSFEQPHSIPRGRTNQTGEIMRRKRSTHGKDTKSSTNRSDFHECAEGGKAHSAGLPIVNCHRLKKGDQSDSLRRSRQKQCKERDCKQQGAMKNKKKLNIFEDFQVSAVAKLSKKKRDSKETKESCSKPSKRRRSKSSNIRTRPGGTGRDAPTSQSALSKTGRRRKKSMSSNLNREDISAIVDVDFNFTSDA